jgi:cytochrome c biogenesis protein CcdA
MEGKLTPEQVESLDPRDRWCVNCQRNVFAQKAGASPLVRLLGATLMFVLGGLIGIGIGSLLQSASNVIINLYAAMAIGAVLGLLVALVVIAGDESRCAICKSSNLKDAR